MVLRGINLTAENGEIIAIAGENGAGKSTLMKILSGAYSMDSGKILIDDSEVNFHCPQDSMVCGISMIYQETNLIRDLTVAENIFLVDKKFGNVFVDRKKLFADTAKVLKDMGLNINPESMVGDLSIAEQQLIEITKSLVKDVKLLIMDEPTAALNKKETTQLFEQIRKLKAKGITVFYITHHLDEIFELADRVEVFRDGQVVLSKKIGEVDQAQIVASMVGKQIENFFPKEQNVDYDTVTFEVKGMSCPRRFSDVSFQVHKGEVLGLGGLMGSGNADVLRGLYGDLACSVGTVILNGKEIHVRKPADAIANNIGFLTSDRKTEGLLMQMSIIHNLSFVSLKDFVKKCGYIAQNEECREGKEFMKKVNIHTKDPNTAAQDLSGGNQQKIVFGKWMMTKPAVFMMDEPTRGIDVAAKTEIYNLINSLTKEGVSIIMVSSDIPELVAMSDRVLVFREGNIVKELTGEAISQQNILDYSMREDLK